MRRITIWLLSTVAAVVLAFSYRTSTMGAGGESVAAARPAREPQQTATPTPTTRTPTTSPSPSTASTTGGDGTYDGTVAQTRWGPVQVSITVSGGKITDLAVPIYPNNNHRDEEINAYALPILRQEALDAQSADVDAVSGATVTSDGYRESLQAAVDAAHL